jgi:hypothetical protein
MRVRQGKLTQSATDLANHMSCRHLTNVDLRLARGEIAEPSWENPNLRVMQQRGLEHEKAYVKSLRSKGLVVIDLSHEPEELASEATWAARKAERRPLFRPAWGAVTGGAGPTSCSE